MRCSLCQRNVTRQASRLLAYLAVAFLLPFYQASVFAGGDQVQGDKGQGTVARWAMFEEPMLTVAVALAVLAAGVFIALALLRRRRLG